MDTPQRILNIVSRIPTGCVATYGQIARLADGVNPRYVGYVLHNNPDQAHIPCHRVVNAEGKLARNYAFGGTTAQQKKLEKEGVRCVNGRVDLRRYQWRA